MASGSVETEFIVSISRSRFCLAVIVLVLLSGTFLPAAESFSAKLVGKLKVGKAPHFSDLSGNGRFLYVTAFASNEVAIIDVNTLRSAGSFYAGYEPLGITVSPAGDKIFVTNRKNGLVKVVDAKSYQVIDDIKVGGRPANVVASPSGLLLSLPTGALESMAK